MNVKGIVTPAVTPLRNNEVDESGIAALLDKLKGFGVTGVFPMGSTGLFPLFSTNEHIRVIDLFSKHMPPNIKLFAGVSRNNYDETLQVAKAAKESGADYVVVVTPYYIRRSQDDLYRYYVSLASQIDLNVVIYNIPQFTGVSLEPETLSAIVKSSENVVGIKDSSGDLRKFERYIYEAHSGFAVYQGQDDLLLPSIALGASGGICGTSNIVDWTVRLWKGKTALARPISDLMSVLSSIDFPKGYYYLFWKVVMDEEPQGYMPRDVSDLNDSEESRLYRRFIEIAKGAKE